MEIIVNGRSIPVIEHNVTAHGEISATVPTEILEKLAVLPLVRQVECFKIVNGRIYGERAYGEEQVNRAFERGSLLAESEYCNGILVKNGVIVGILWVESESEKYAVYPFQPVCVYYAEDNNGAGYKTYEEYITLICA